jgi:putative membrane protein
MKRVLAVVASLSLIAMGTMAASVSAAGSKLSSTDMKFVMNAASGGMMEVQLGQMAQEKGTDQSVKDFGSRMVTDHAKANDELKQLASQKGIQLPAKLERKDQAAIDKLSKVSGDFDKKYMKDMVKDHKKDVAEFKKAAKKVKDPDLNAWAQKTLPVLEQHLQLAKDTEQKLTGKMTKATK